MWNESAVSTDLVSIILTVAKDFYIMLLIVMMTVNWYSGIVICHVEVRCK